MDVSRSGTLVIASLAGHEAASTEEALLGNHDHHDDRPDEVAAILWDAGGHVLEGEATVVAHRGLRIGVAGTKGFGGGFVGRCAGEFGEPVMKEFVRYSRQLADGLRIALEDLHGRECDVRIALTHFAPVPDTLVGEPLEIHPFLGSYLLAEAIDTAGADLAVHGHAHAGTEHGMTGGGVKVRNVAQPVIGRAFHVYSLNPLDPWEGAGATGTRSPTDTVEQ
ncbi:metallophosphoesterase [Streptomyces sp. NPDC007901]|uniref:metallophosphoesterase family protein n=1 Tax=Streptomyces sp. NPDC007901 TaxID=3364785 RepID=UPI0036EE2374